MSHQLEWSRGSHGKGLLHPDGSVVTWNTDGAYGSPHHAEMAGVGFEDTPEVHRNLQAFDISPEGEVSFSMLAGDTPLRQEVFKADPRLYLTKDEPRWSFSAVEAADGSKPKPNRKMPDPSKVDWEWQKEEWAKRVQDESGWPNPWPYEEAPWRSDHAQNPIQAGVSPTQLDHPAPFIPELQEFLKSIDEEQPQPLSPHHTSPQDFQPAQMGLQPVQASNEEDGSKKPSIFKRAWAYLT